METRNPKPLSGLLIVDVRIWTLNAFPDVSIYSSRPRSGVQGLPVAEKTYLFRVPYYSFYI